MPGKATDMPAQLSLFRPDVEVERTTGGLEPPEPTTAIRLGHRKAQAPLRKRRKQALEKLKDALAELEGKDIHIGYCSGCRGHFWLHNLKLSRLKVEPFPIRSAYASVVVLWGSREASVRLFTEQLVDVRRQEYQGYTLWLVDFWNGFGEHPVDAYRPPGYDSLAIARFKDKVVSPKG